MANSEHTVKLNLDFSDFVKKAAKAGEQSSDLIGKALESGISTHSMRGFMQASKDYEVLRTKSEKRMAALQYALSTQRMGNEDRELTRLAAKIAKKEQALQRKSLSEETREKMKAEVEIFKEKEALLKKIKNSGNLGYDEEVSSLVKGLKESERQQEKLTKQVNQMARGSARAKDFMSIFRRDAEKGVDDFNEGLGDALESFKDGLSGIDIGASLSKGTKGIGKGLGSLSEMASGAGAKMGGSMGGLVSALGGIAAVLGPLVIAFGVFGAMMLDIDKETKEFNKSAINTFGTRSVMNIGAPRMRDNLRVLQHVTMDLNKTMGMTSDEAMGVFDALDSGGITLKRLTQNAVTLEGKEKALTETLTKVASTAKALGVSVGEFAGTLAEYTDTLGFSLSSVADQFANISEQASDAGFSTRRFYSLITQASSGQASLNTHLDVTSQLLVRMAKTLGDKAAAETLGSASGAFKDMGTQERYKFMMTSGKGRVRKTISADAERQASSFVGDSKRADVDQGALNKAFEEAAAAGVVISAEARGDTSGRLLVKELGKLSRDQQGVLLQALSTSSDRTVQGLGRGIDQLTTLSRGASGSDADMADALSALSAGGTMEAKMNSAMAILGKPLDELTGIDRMAAENITGMSGAQIEQYQALARASQGSWKLLKVIQKKPLPGVPGSAERLAAQADQDKRFGGHIADNGEIVTADLKKVTSATDLLSATVARGDLETGAAVDKNYELASQAFDETVTMSDLLQNDISNWLRGIYEDVGLPLIDMVGDLLEKFKGGPTRKERQGARDMRGALVKSVSKSKKEALQAKHTISNLEKKSRADRTPEEEQQLRDARISLGSAQASTTASEAALGRLSSGNTYDLRAAGRTYSVGGAQQNTFSEEGTTEGPERTYSTRKEAEDAIKEENERRRLRRKSISDAGGNASVGLENQALVVRVDEAHLNGQMAANDIDQAARARGGVAAARADTASRTPAAAATPSWDMMSGVETTPNAGTSPGVMLNNAGVPVPATATAPAHAPVTAPAAIAPAVAAAVAEVVPPPAAAVDPVEAAVNTGTTIATDENAETQKAIKKAQVDANKHITKVFTKDTKLGDALARSNLPDAIVAAQVKQQIAALASAAGLDPEDAAKAMQEYAEDGTYSKKLTEGLKNLNVEDRATLSPLITGTGGLDKAGSFRSGRNFLAHTPDVTTGRPMDDFIYRGDGVRGNITPIDTSDQFVGMKPGGPVDKAMQGGGGGGGGGGGNVSINIYGGDERKVFDVVKRVLQQSGIGPGRVAARA